LRNLKIDKDESEIAKGGGEALLSNKNFLKNDTNPIGDTENNPVMIWNCGIFYLPLSYNQTPYYNAYNPKLKPNIKQKNKPRLGGGFYLRKRIHLCNNDANRTFSIPTGNRLE
jgi:hypothetical protein